MSKVSIRPPKGRLAVLTPGVGAVSTTFMAGVEAVRTGLADPIGSLTQMGTIRLGKRTENRTPLVRDFVPLAKLEDLLHHKAGLEVLVRGNDDARHFAAGLLREKHFRIFVAHRHLTPFGRRLRSPGCVAFPSRSTRRSSRPLP